MQAAPRAICCVALLAAQGIANPYAIVSTAIGATLCSTIVAIIAVKFFERLPMFRIDSAKLAAESEAAAKRAATEGKPEEKSLRKFGPGSRAIVVGIFVLFAGIVLLEWFPNSREGLQKQIGLYDVAQALDAEKPSLEESTASDPGLWLRGVMAVSVTAIPFVLFFFIVFAALRGIPVYEEFVEGAKEGFQVAVRIMPFLVAMLTALAIVRHSGLLFLLQTWMSPVLEFLRFPPELVPMALMRPLSGSGSQGVLVEILTNEGIADTIKYTAATMFGSTETTFFVLAVYFGSVAIRRTRHALAAGLCADLAGVIAAVVICRAVFG